MIRAQERAQQYSDILISIKGVMFFGTPHQGADAVWWAGFAANLTKGLELGRGTNKQYLEALERNSPELRNISLQWVERAANVMMIRTFFETDRMRLVGLIVSGSASSALFFAIDSMEY
jgi:hypothetical protein